MCTKIPTKGCPIPRTEGRELCGIQSVILFSGIKSQFHWCNFTFYKECWLQQKRKLSVSHFEQL